LLLGITVIDELVLDEGDEESMEISGLTTTTLSVFVVVEDFEYDGEFDLTISDDDMLDELIELGASLALLFDLVLVDVGTFEEGIFSNEPRVS